MLPDVQQCRDGDAQQLGNTVGTRHPADVLEAVHDQQRDDGATRVANVQTAATAIMAIA